MLTFMDPAKREKRATVNLTAQEEALILDIVRQRKEKGLSKDTAHFIRQCFHFLISREYLEGYEFWIPETYPRQSPTEPNPQPANTSENV